MLVRPITTNPARRRRATTGASSHAGGASSSAREPARDTCPLISNRVLDRDRNAGERRRLGVSPAQPVHGLGGSDAASASTWMKTRAPSPASSAIFARQSSTSLRAVIRPVARSAAAWPRSGDRTWQNSQAHRSNPVWRFRSLLSCKSHERHKFVSVGKKRQERSSLKLALGTLECFRAKWIPVRVKKTR